jgi:hypothetical protein
MNVTQPGDVYRWMVEQGALVKVLEYLEHELGGRLRESRRYLPAMNFEGRK